jgi:hypothetical protein
MLALGTAPAWSQQSTGDAGRGQVTRQELQDLLVLHERSVESPAYSETLRTRSRVAAGLIRERLQRGDFQVGDRVELSIEGQPSLTDTFVVTEGPVLRLPLIREVSLAGVLRSELETHMRTEVGKFMDDPQVRAIALTRLSIIGAVPRPGFYTAPSEALVSDALMLAGGPGGGARVDAITIERMGQRLWSVDEVKLAIIEGRTLDQLDIRDGDRIRIPQPSRGLAAVQGAFSWLTMLSTVPITIFSVSRLF